MRVGFIGLGNMGFPMAANLAAAGHALVVADLDDLRCARFADAHDAIVATSPERFADVDAVITMLPDDRAVAAALLDGGVAAALSPGAVVVDMSSCDPVATQRLGARLPRGVALVDAPVSGGVPRATDGTLAIMAGTDDPAALERVRPLLERMGQRIFETGRLGSGHATKALNNYLGAAAYVAGTEAMLIGARFGLDLRTLLDVVNASTGRSFTSEVVLAGNVVTGQYATGFALGLLAKDVGIAASLGAAMGADAPALEVVATRWAEAAEGLEFGADHSHAHERWWPQDADRFVGGAQDTPAADSTSSDAGGVA
jgi:3-hydroxyisobutyrate dehydrogenase